MANKVIDPAPIIKDLADRCLKSKGLECSVLGRVIDLLKAAPAVDDAPYWATERAYKNGYEAGKRDAVEVVHGRWLYVDGKGSHAEYECNQCRAHVCFDMQIDGSIPAYKYCPNCGAKMEG